MAQSISLNVPHRDPRIVLLTRLQDAPAEHAKALLDAYQVLQGLHDTGALDILRGMLGSRDKVLDVAVDAAGSAYSVRVMRNSLLLINMLAAIEPEARKRFTDAGARAVNALARQPKSSGIWALTKDVLWNRDTRFGLTAATATLKALGASLSRSSQANG